MTVHAPIAVNHVRSPYPGAKWTRGDYSPTHWWDQPSHARARLCRAVFTHFNKRRLWLGIPYHEWEEALILAKFTGNHACPTFDVSPVRDLVEAYDPPIDVRTGLSVRARRQAPWTIRERRMIAAHRSNRHRRKPSLSATGRA